MLNLILATDPHGGIGKDGQLPWSNKLEMRWFQAVTLAKKINFTKNVLELNEMTFIPDAKKFENTFTLTKSKTIGKNLLIVGRKTAATFNNSLPQRQLFILSKTKGQTMQDALNLIKTEKFDQVWVIGGLEIYNLVLTRYRHLIQYVFLSKLVKDYTCDQYFDFDLLNSDLDFEYQYNFNELQPIQVENFIREQVIPSFTVHIYKFNYIHEEEQYRKLLTSLLTVNLRSDRTGLGTYSTFGQQFRFDLRHSVPLLTSKKVNWQAALHELLFFISGQTNTNILSQKGIKIWEPHTSEKFLKLKGFDYQVGDMGPMYGFQWRHWNAKYLGAQVDYAGQGIDQLQNLIENIKSNPDSRAHLLTALNIEQLGQGVLPPCHTFCQFYVDNGYLSCHLYQRSADLFLGVPFNIISYSFLTYMIAFLCGLKPKELIISYGDSHIYSNHLNVVKQLLENELYAFPTLKLVNTENVKTIDDFEFHHFELQEYVHNKYIKADIAV